jgi:hypothetical protein
LIVAQVLKVVPRVNKSVVLLLNMGGRVAHRSPKASLARIGADYYNSLSKCSVNLYWTKLYLSIIMKS